MDLFWGLRTSVKAILVPKKQVMKAFLYTYAIWQSLELSERCFENVIIDSYNNINSYYN